MKREGEDVVDDNGRILGLEMANQGWDDRWYRVTVCKTPWMMNHGYCGHGMTVSLVDDKENEDHGLLILYPGGRMRCRGWLPEELKKPQRRPLMHVISLAWNTDGREEGCGKGARWHLAARTLIRLRDFLSCLTSSSSLLFNVPSVASSILSVLQHSVRPRTTILLVLALRSHVGPRPEDPANTPNRSHHRMSQSYPSSTANQCISWLFRHRDHCYRPETRCCYLPCQKSFWMVRHFVSERAIFLCYPCSLSFGF